MANIEAHKPFDLDCRCPRCTHAWFAGRWARYMGNLDDVDLKIDRVARGLALNLWALVLCTVACIVTVAVCWRW